MHTATYGSGPPSDLREVAWRVYPTVLDQFGLHDVLAVLDAARDAPAAPHVQHIGLAAMRHLHLAAALALAVALLCVASGNLHGYPSV